MAVLRRPSVPDAVNGDRAPLGARLEVASPTADSADHAHADGREQGGAPTVVVDLLCTGANQAAREAAWSRFVAEHSRLLLHVARRAENGYDDAMDAYAYLLERLRRDDFRALRGYQFDGRSRFTTWLVVVARRMCLDYRRHRYGRPRAREATPASDVERRARRELARFGATSSSQLALLEAATLGPEERLRLQQLHTALDAAIAELDAEEQLLLRLRFDDGRAVPDIARLLHAPSPFHVYRRLKAICAKLRRGLEFRGFDGGAA